MRAYMKMFNTFFKILAILIVTILTVSCATTSVEGSSEPVPQKNVSDPNKEGTETNTEETTPTTAKPLTAKEARAAKKAKEAQLKAEKEAQKAHAKEAKKKEKEAKKKYSLLKFFLETPPASRNTVRPVLVYRSNPETIHVDTDAFIDERDFKEVNLITGEDGSYQIEFVLTSEGASVLQNTTVRSRGRRIVIFANFGDPRYLAAPKIDRIISDGTFRITPDASLPEMERFVLGMKNTIRTLRKKSLGI